MKPEDQFAGKGATEGDRPDDPQQFNRNAGPLGDNGLPADPDPVCEDVLGANVDHQTRDAGAAGAAVDASETGETVADGTDSDSRDAGDH